MCDTPTAVSIEELLQVNMKNERGKYQFLPGKLFYYFCQVYLGKSVIFSCCDNLQWYLQLSETWSLLKADCKPGAHSGKDASGKWRPLRGSSSLLPVIIFVISQGAKMILSNKHYLTSCESERVSVRGLPPSQVCFHLQTAVQTPGNPA